MIGRQILSVLSILFSCVVCTTFELTHVPNRVLTIDKVEALQIGESEGDDIKLQHLKVKINNNYTTTYNFDLTWDNV